MADFPTNDLLAGLTPRQSTPDPFPAYSLPVAAVQVETTGPGPDLFQELVSAPPLDILTPQVSNQTPVPGSMIGVDSVISFDVTDDRDLMFTEIQVEQVRREIAHDGETFLDPYLGSVRVPVPGGWRYQLRRTGGWVRAPTIRVRAFDRSFNEA